MGHTFVINALRAHHGLCDTTSALSLQLLVITTAAGDHWQFFTTGDKAVELPHNQLHTTTCSYGALADLPPGYKKG
jgi:hypothetical protein